MQFETSTNVTQKTFNIKLEHKPMRPSVIDAFISHFERIGGKAVEHAGNWVFPAFVTRPLIEEIIRNTCFVCGGLMQDGVAVQNSKITVSSYDNATETYCGEVEYPDFTQLKRIKVRKCTVCGHSHT